ncbi:hypothetical protein [Daejeonella oryzae]|uniref:hypothetical protein n=1 Tax=Daejeonella oryzae TaxID=1122943 RepID=UPI00040915B4|nr:hypothetical protein [Daejeonella oryzae]
MKKENLKDAEIILMAAAAALTLIGFIALAAKRFSAPRFKFLQPKDHSYLKIDKRTLEKYVERKGAKIKFDFTEDNGRVKLNFIGFTRDNRQCIKKKMDAPNSKIKKLENIDFGVFSEDENKRPLHDILTNEPLKDWYLTPEKSNIKSGYVGYDMRDFDSINIRTSALLAYRINPCPPGC